MRKNILFIAFSFLIFSMSAQNKKSDAYTDFPTKAEWEEIWSTNDETVHDKVMAAMQVPDVLLAKMSTEGLLETCMLYPANRWILTDAQGNYQNTYRFYVDRSNAYAAFFKRTDAAAVALKMYNDFDYASADEVYLEKGNTMDFAIHHTKAMCLGMLLGQEEMINKMTDAQKIEAIKIGLEKADDIDDSEVYGGTSRGMIFYPIPSIMDRADFSEMKLLKEENENVRNYLSTAHLVSREDLQSILERAKKFINE